MTTRKNEEQIDFPMTRLETQGAIAAEMLEEEGAFVDEIAGQVVRAKKPAVPAFITTTLQDAEGNVLKSFTRGKKYENGGGFVISYTAKMCEFLEKCSTGSIVRVFLYIAHNQQFGTDGKTFGWRASHKYLRTLLGITKPTLWDALKYLKDNYLVHVGRIEGYNEFMVNPDYVTIGQDKQARRKEWNRRWAETLRRHAD